MYDPMVSKLIVWDIDREQATRRMVRALREYEIGGLKTLLPFHEAILQTSQWANAETCRDLIEDRAWLKTLAFPPIDSTPGDQPETVGREYTVEVSGKRFDVKVIGAPAGGADPVLPVAGGAVAAVNGARPVPRRAARARAGGNGGGGDVLLSPLQGTVFKVVVEPGAAVEEGALICVIEAMKMENEITAHKTGVIAELPVAFGAAVSTGDTLAVISTNGDARS